MCWDDRKSFPKSSHGSPPVPEGLAQSTIVRVPPLRGAWVGEGVADVVVVVVGAVDAGLVVVVAVGVCPEEQPSNDSPMTRRAVKRAMILFIMNSLMYISNLRVISCAYQECFITRIFLTWRLWRS